MFAHCKNIDRCCCFRYKNNSLVILKSPPSPVVAAYNFAREISDPEALDELLTDPDEMRMQALVIRERILGPAHPDTSYYIRYRGAIYADSGQYGRCIELWNYALDMQQSMLEPLDPTTQSSFINFTELFNYMMIGETTTGRRVPPVQKEELIRVFKKAVSPKRDRCKRFRTYILRSIEVRKMIYRFRSWR